MLLFLFLRGVSRLFSTLFALFPRRQARTKKAGSSIGELPAFGSEFYFPFSKSRYIMLGWIPVLF